MLNLDLLLPAQILVELAELQDSEVGDGTTSVVIAAAELLRRANELVRGKIHPTNIISGFRSALKESVKQLQDKFAVPIDSLSKNVLLNAAKTSISSKLVGTEADYFANLVVDAMQAVRTETEDFEVRYPVKAVNVLKAHGQSATESTLLNGYAVNIARAAMGMPRTVSAAKIACVDFDLRKTKMQMGVQISVDDPRELEKIREREGDITKERVQKILGAGANVVFCSKGIDDMSLKYFVEAGAIACRRVPKEDLRRIARATGAGVVTTLADMEGAETFDAENLGTAEEVSEERISDDDMTLIKKARHSKAVTLLLRGANDYMLDEMDRSLHDALSVVKRVLESGEVVPGGGATEAALSVHLEHFALSMGSREQLAVAEFADSLLALPKALAVNAAKDATELVARLRAYHYKAQHEDSKSHLSNYGLDLINGQIKDNLSAGVLEPVISKKKMLELATEAAITILRIDDKIELQANEEQQ